MLGLIGWVALSGAIWVMLATAYTTRGEFRGAFMHFVCTHRRPGKRLDSSNPERRRELGGLIEIDEAAVRERVLRPLELWVVYGVK